MIEAISDANTVLVRRKLNIKTVNILLIIECTPNAPNIGDKPTVWRPFALACYMSFAYFLAAFSAANRAAFPFLNCS